jgi:hypothetical protein
MATTEFNPKKRKRGRSKSGFKILPLVPVGVKIRADQKEWLDNHPDCYKKVLDLDNSSESVRFFFDWLKEKYQKAEEDKEYEFWGDVISLEDKQKMYREAEALNVPISTYMKEMFFKFKAGISRHPKE